MERFKIGDLVAGKYEITRVLGRGGMGVVVAARHLELGQDVALKFLRPSSTDRPETYARFARETRTASRIKSEHVVRVRDVGTVDGAPFIVMECLTGEDLAHVIKRRGPLPCAEAVDLLLQACEALAEAHTLGIVHRDLKPANLFLTARTDGSPCVKVLDFGISKSTSLEDVSVTASAAVVGSPLYMSPEQLASSRSADARSDVWALGVILYEMVTGTDPALADIGSRVEGCDQYLAVQVVLAMGGPPTGQDVRADIERFYGIAKASLASVWPAVLAVAQALLRQSELDSDGFFAAIADHQIYTPVFAVQDDHGLR